jgi:hypothetical protein
MGKIGGLPIIFSPLSLLNLGIHHMVSYLICLAEYEKFKVLDDQITRNSTLNEAAKLSIIDYLVFLTVDVHIQNWAVNRH